MQREDEIYFDVPLMAVLNINLEHLEDLSVEQRKSVLQALVDYWSDKDGYDPKELLPSEGL